MIAGTLGSSKFPVLDGARWLSYEGSIQGVVDNFLSVVTVMLEGNPANTLTVYKPISCYIAGVIFSSA